MTQPRSEADIPDLNGTTAVVTGAGSGIGQDVARGLAAMGAMVVLAVRRVERGEAAASAIRATSPRASLEVMASDRSYDEGLARRLWQVSEGLTGVRYEFDGPS